MIEALICDRKFRPCVFHLGPLNFPHATVAKNNYNKLEVEHGIWRLDETREVNVTEVVRQLDYELHCDGVPFMLHPVKFEEYWDLRLHHVCGGEAHNVLHHIQSSLKARLESLDDHVHYPDLHISFEC